MSDENVYVPCLISFIFSHILTVVGWWEVLIVYVWFPSFTLTSWRWSDDGELLCVGFFSHILLVVVVGWWRYVLVLGSFSHIKLVGWWGNPSPLVAFLLYLSHVDSDCSRMKGSFNCLCLISFLHSHILMVVGWWRIIMCWFLLSNLESGGRWVMKMFISHVWFPSFSLTSWQWLDDGESFVALLGSSWSHLLDDGENHWMDLIWGFLL